MLSDWLNGLSDTLDEVKKDVTGGVPVFEVEGLAQHLL